MTDAPAPAASAPASLSLPSFDEMPLSDDVKASLAEMGYTHPTPVQHAVYEPAVRGNDLVVQARTGTGKTAAFGLPLVDQLLRRSSNAVQALVLTPTRELALQVSRELTKIGSKRGIINAAIYGGVPIDRQVQAIRNGVHMIIGTPGRVLDHLRRGTLDPKNIRILVLDESDEMLSMGFARELNAILDFLPAERQTLLFSATLPPEIATMAADRLHSPVFLTLSGDQVGALDVTHVVYLVREDKTGLLLRIIEVDDPTSAIVFCNTRDETERLAGALGRAGYEVDWLNGDLPQSDREKVMLRTKEGKIRFLVATDVAARGIDISHLSHVINFDFPETPEAYVHRTGRTGRMGSMGTAISLIRPQDIGGLYYLRLAYKIRPFEKQIPSAGELKTRAETDLIQMLVEAFGATEPHPDDLALARRLLTHERCESLLAGLLRTHLGERPNAQEEAAAARRARTPKPQPASAPVEATPSLGATTSHDPQHRPAPLPPRDRATRQRPMRGRPPRAYEESREREVVFSEETPPEPIARQEQSAPQIPEVAAPVEAPLLRPAPRLNPPPRRAEVAPRETRMRDRPRARPMRDDDIDDDLPRYEMTSMPEDTAAPSVDVPVPAHAHTTDIDLAGRGHAALADWTPPEEDNDDVPILGGDDNISTTDADLDVGEHAEVFVNIGRRDGVRAEDFLRALDGTSGVTRRDVLRIRLRDRHTFLMVRRETVDGIVATLNGCRIAGKAVTAEPARVRGPQFHP